MKRFIPIFEIVVGIVLLVTACALFRIVADNIQSGESYNFSKLKTHSIVSKNDDPDRYFQSVTISAVGNLMIASISIWILIDGSRKLRK
ncbi:MAG TPA: hypothetical protein VIK59_07715 [Verrucomicrobiae bacterium]